MLLVEHGLATVAFPAISTGAYAYPIDSATEIAIGTTKSVLDEAPTIERVVFCCFSAADAALYERVAAELL